MSLILDAANMIALCPNVRVTIMGTATLQLLERDIAAESASLDSWYLIHDAKYVGLSILACGVLD